MSSYLHIRCLDCIENCERPRLNWGEKPLTKLLEEMPKLLTAWSNDWDVSVKVECRGNPVDMPWFEKHAGHKLSVIDDCGYLKPCACGTEHSGPCGEEVC
mgnify:CR=1 FL=1